MNTENTKILIVDDHPFFCATLKSQLSKHFSQISCISEPKKVIPAILKETPDIIILDNQMPDITGIELTQKIKKIPNLKNTHILLYTADAYPETVKDALKAGVSDFIVKNAPIKKILEKINSLLGAKKDNA